MFNIYVTNKILCAAFMIVSAATSQSATNKYLYKREFCIKEEEFNYRLF